MAAQDWPTSFVTPPSDFVPGIVVNGQFQRTRGWRDLSTVLTSRHAAELTFDLRTPELEARWQGMIMDMIHRNATYKMPWYGYPQKFGDGGGTVTVNGGHVAGAETVAISGATGSPFLRAGALVSMAGPSGSPFIYRLVAQSAGSNLEIAPGLHEAVSGGATVTYAPNPATNTYLLTTVSVDPSVITGGSDAMAEYGEIEEAVFGITMRFVETVRDVY